MKVLHSPFLILTVLLGITLASFALFETHATPALVGLGVVGLAALKIILIVTGYMEVRTRHVPVGPALTIWIAAATLIVGGGFVLG
ncbi:MAG: hypothetical protein AB7G24_07510 [Novosphingobium sp.]